MATYIYVASTDGDQISVFSMDAATGNLTPKSEVAASGGPFLLAINPNKEFLYAGHRNVPEISSWRVDQGDGSLSKIGTITPETGPSFMSTDRKGRYLLSSFYQSGHAAVHPIGDDGVVYIGSLDNKLYALDGKTGVKKWEFEIQKRPFSSPVVGFNNTVYAASVEADVKNGVFCALDGKTGGKKWEHKAKKNVTTYAPTIVPAIGSDNVVYLGISLDTLGDEGKLIALDGKTGTVKWEFDLNCLPSPPVIGADKNIYFGTWGADAKGMNKGSIEFQIAKASPTVSALFVPLQENRFTVTALG